LFSIPCIIAPIFGVAHSAARSLEDEDIFNLFYFETNRSKWLSLDVLFYRSHSVSDESYRQKPKLSIWRLMCVHFTMISA
jgi:hypothetical protein